MDVAITGSSGLIGTAIAKELELRGDRVRRVVRRTAGPGEVGWDIDAGIIDVEALEGVDGVIHLAGAGIGDKRWTEERKREITESRTLGTSLLADALTKLRQPPAVFLSGSAVGWYGGDRGDELLTESATPGTDYKAGICIAWEQAAQPAVDAGIRTVFLRTGIVLTADGGVVRESLPFFKLGIAGRFGAGDQWWAWISMADQLAAMLFLLDNPVAGPVNLTAPNPVTNVDYTKAFGRAVNRPTWLPTPRFAADLKLGREGTEAIVLASTRAVPDALLGAGFEFSHPTIDEAFAAIL